MTAITHSIPSPTSATTGRRQVRAVAAALLLAHVAALTIVALAV